jgi:uncharacterized protein (DUF2062 family)
VPEKNPERKFFQLLRRSSFKELIRYLIKLENDPRKVAQSIALGTFIGIIVPMGLQTVAAFPLSLLFGCNVVIATLSTLITNPLTVVPLYLTALFIGEYLTGIVIPWYNVKIFLENKNLEALLNLGSDISYVFIIGLAVEGFILAIFFYFMSYYIMRFGVQSQTKSSKTR